MDNTYLKQLTLPAFFPDATYMTIHSIPFDRVIERLDGIVITSLHAYALGTTTITSKLPHGFHSLANLPKHIITLSDSGGFQVLSLIHNKKLGKITPEGAIFKYPHSGQTIKLTPELSQQIQAQLKTDIRVVLDYPTMGNESAKDLEHAVKITTLWAKRAKKEFLKLTSHTTKTFNNTKPQLKQVSSYRYSLQLNRPLLTAVVQGGNQQKLRLASANELRKIGFDIYGFGGWPLNTQTPQPNKMPSKKLNISILEYFLKIIPSDSIPYAMGLGTPDDIYTLTRMGYLLFDCVLPTRNARHGLIYVTKGTGEPYGKTYDVLHIKSSRYTLDTSPLDPTCDCPVCRHYNRAYVRFLLKRKNPVGFTLASIHNIWWYQRFMVGLRETGSFPIYKNLTPTASETPEGTEPQDTLSDQVPPQENVTHATSVKLKNIQDIPKKPTGQAFSSDDQKLQVTDPNSDTIFLISDAAVKVKNAHLKGHSGRGKASGGYYAKYQDKILFSNTVEFPEMTIPEAEFRSALLGLKKLFSYLAKTKKLPFPKVKRIILFSDSQLLINWLSGKYRIKAEHIKPLYEEYQKLQSEFLKHGIVIEPKWHKRSSQSAQIADRLANLIN